MTVNIRCFCAKYPENIRYTKYCTSSRCMYLLENSMVSLRFLRNREISEYPIGESTHLLQNREISGIRIGFLVSSRCCKIAKNIPKYPLGYWRGSYVLCVYNLSWMDCVLNVLQRKLYGE
jgi:hypothetical protein